MSEDVVINTLGQPVGFPVPNWTRRPDVPWTPLIGRTCRLDPLNVETHARDLFDAFSLDPEGRNWTNLKDGPFPDFPSFHAWLEDITADKNRLDYVITDGRTDRAVGMICYTCIEPDHGSIEVGGMKFSPLMQRTTMGTEAMYLMMRRAFDELGYRRYAYRCNLLNFKSREAAVRFGFRSEATFRQRIVYGGRNGDITWFSILDSEWPKLRAAYEKWLSPENFDKDGKQRQRLSDLTRHLLTKLPECNDLP